MLPGTHPRQAQLSGDRCNLPPFLPLHNCSTHRLRRSAVLGTFVSSPIAPLTIASPRNLVLNSVAQSTGGDVDNGRTRAGKPSRCSWLGSGSRSRFLQEALERSVVDAAEDTLAEVAKELRCSKAHVSKLVN